jgi:hypothetical protein
MKSRNVQSCLQAAPIIAVLAIIGCQRNSGNANIEEPTASAPADSESGNVGNGFSFTHVEPPVIDEDQPNFKISVPVHNTTGAEVRFDHVGRTCSCADADLKSRTLAPGGTTTLEVSIRARGRSGAQRVSVNLTDSNHRRWDYLIETTVFPRARFTVPNEQLQLEVCDPAQSITRQFDLELFGASKESLPVLSRLESLNPAFAVALGDSAMESVAGGLFVRRIPVKLSYRTPGHAGPYHGEIRAHYAYSNEQRIAQLGISGVVRSLYEVAPQYVFFGQIGKDSQPIVRKVVIRRYDGKGLTVGNLIISTPEVAARTSNGSDIDQITVELELKSKNLAEPLWGDVTIETNDSKQPSIKLSFAAMPENLAQRK